jgi:hypothetical protein
MAPVRFSRCLPVPDEIHQLAAVEQITSQQLQKTRVLAIDRLFLQPDEGEAGHVKMVNQTIHSIFAHRTTRPRMSWPW